MENNLPLVSVIIPTYNREKTILRAIKSVIVQTYQNWELIIVDDCSNDKTSRVVSPLIKTKKNIFYHIAPENGGACIARNIGLKLAKGRYITFLDSDDEYLTNKIEKQVALFQESGVENLGVVSCGREDVNDKGEVYHKAVPRYKGDILKKLLLKKNVGAGTPFLMIKREVIEEGIFFDPEMPAGQDYDFLLRISQKYQFDFVAEPLVRVHHHDMERVYSNKTALRAFDLQYKKYKDLLIACSAHKNFSLKQSDLLFVYGYNEKAIKLLEERLPFSLDKYLWKIYFKVFRSPSSKISRLLLKLLRNVYFK